MTSLQDNVRAVLCPLHRFFANPHHVAGSVMAKLTVNIATILWSTVLLSKRDSLIASGSRYAFITEYLDENYIAAFFGLIAVAQTACLWTHREPTMLRNVGYAVLSFSWGFIFFVIAFREGPIQATSFATSGTIALVALYAFLDGKPELELCDSEPGR